MVKDKKKIVPPQRKISQSTPGSFEESLIYQLIATCPVDQVASALREAIFSNYEDVHMSCPDTGTTYLHLVAAHNEKFADARALPAVYMLCYGGIDVSAQDEEGDTVLHKLVRKQGAYKVIIALFRYGIDSTLKNKRGFTAEEYMEYEQPPGYKETLHWYRKFAPGLYCSISDGAYPLTQFQVDTLLKSWCKVTVFIKSKACNLLQLSQMRAKDALLAEALKKHFWTNEFVHATLAGLPEEMKRIYKEGKKRIDVDTVDESYQLNIDSPVAPQPLIAAAWEQSNYDVIDLLLSFDADVCNSYTSLPETNKPKPLFYQTLLGTPRVTDLNIMLRILQEGDLRCKTEDATTFLHESVRYALPPVFVARLFSLDCPLEEREKDGLTARQLAVRAGNQPLVQVFDDEVVRSAKEGDIKRLESLVLNLYEVNDVKSQDGRSLQQLADDREFPSKVQKFIKTIPEIQAQMVDLWRAMYRNDLVQVKKYLSSKDLKRIVYSRNRCGRSILLQAILNKNKEAIHLILRKHAKLVEYFDNNMLTCLHYVFVFFEDKDREPAQLLQAAGASVDWCCTAGMSAYFYQKGVMEDSVFHFVQNFISEASLRVYPNREALEEAFRQACVTGSMDQIKALVDEFSTYGSISILSQVLFDVVDAGHEDMAIYLIQEGCDTDISKQYETCSPNNELCAMMECFHPTTSLLHRAQVCQLQRLVNVINQQQGGAAANNATPHQHNLSNTTQQNHTGNNVMAMEVEELGPM